LIGAACYAELASAYPRDGGDYVYLTRAFGRPTGFLFAWSQLWIVRPGSIGALAFVFAEYFKELLPIPGDTGHTLLYAAGAIVVLTANNVVSVKQYKWTQNLLTTVKVLGLAAVGASAFLPTVDAVSAAPVASASNADANYYKALILVLFVYGGWNEMAYVGAEVRRPEKNLLRSLFLGTAAVTLIYVLLNAAFVYALGLGGVQNAGAIAADVVRRVAPAWGGKAIAALVCVSSLGAVNGLIFTGSRIPYAMGTEHPLWACLGRWNARHGTPIWSLLVQAIVTLALVVGFGLREGAFGRLVNFTTPFAWFFFALVGVSLFVLRIRDPHVPRPYRVTGYPITPLIFSLSSLFLVYSGLIYWWKDHSSEVYWSSGIMLVGLALAFADRSQRD
jgi:amino acid transporter